jgi:hypothetical protein
LSCISADTTWLIWKPLFRDGDVEGLSTGNLVSKLALSFLQSRREQGVHFRRLTERQLQHAGSHRGAEQIGVLSIGEYHSAQVGVGRKRQVA